MELPTHPLRRDATEGADGILRFLHTWLQSDQAAEQDLDRSALSGTPTILREVIALVGPCDPAHFKGVAALVCPRPIHAVNFDFSPCALFGLGPSATLI